MKGFKTFCTMVFLVASHGFAEDTITINVDCCGFDAEKKMILVTRNPEMSKESSTGLKTVAKIDKNYRFAEPVAALEPGKTFCLLNAQNDTFTMHVTSLPTSVYRTAAAQLFLWQKNHSG